MSNSLRIESVTVETTAGPVFYRFSGPLTILTGPVGTGKSTLLDLMKFAFGGGATRTPVVDTYVTAVIVEIIVEGIHYALARDIDSAEIAVSDMSDRREIGRYSADSKRENSISSYLLELLGLPIDATASSQGRSTRKPARITFNDIFAYLYVDQPDIDREIVSHNDNYRTPKRKTVFELLFGLSDIELNRLQADLQTVRQELDSARADENRIRRFLTESQMIGQDEALLQQERLEAERDRSLARLERLRSESDPDDARVDVARDLLTSAKVRLEKANSDLADTERSIEERSTLLASARQEQRRLNRMRDAVGRLAAIEFTVCPRCTQSIKGRDIPDGCCSLCLQDESPDTLMTAPLDINDSYELVQLEDQISEIEHLLTASELDRQSLTEYIQSVGREVASLAAEVDQRTRELISPRLQAFADSTRQVAEAETRLKALDETLRLWDGVGDMARAALEAANSKERLEASIDFKRQQMASYRSDLFEQLTDQYQRTVWAFGIPSVTQAEISSDSYLPVVDGKKFDTISTGGIRTALVVAYWLTLLSTAARDRTLDHPRILILDSPRKSIGAGEQLAENLYRQLDALARAYTTNIQVIVADNKLPSESVSSWQQIVFDYDTNPALNTIGHPGPSRVQTLDGRTDELD